MTRALTVSFKLEALDTLATRLERVERSGRLAVAAVDAVNAVTRRADDSLRRGETAGINLSPAYVKSKTDMVLASPGSAPRASIITKGDPTILGRFAPLSRVVAPGAQRRDGPIKGFRSAGTNVAIRRGQFRMEPQWFIMRLRAGTEPGVNYGVFVRDDALPAKNTRGSGYGDPNRKRDGKAGKRHIYGPSPYQLFREQIRVQRGAIEDDLQRTATDGMGRAIEEILG